MKTNPVVPTDGALAAILRERLLRAAVATIDRLTP